MKSQIDQWRAFPTEQTFRPGKQSGVFGPMLGLLLIACGIGFFIPLRAVHADEKIKLDEPATDSRVYSVNVKFKVTGDLRSGVNTKKPVAMKLDGDAGFKYLERRLSGSGRDAESVRSVRQYTEAEAKISVSGSKTSSRLSDERRLVVVQGRRFGGEIWSLSGPLTPGESELLKHPGDSLSMLSLLPSNPVAVGEKWEPENWVVQSICRVEAVEKSELKCELVSLKEKIATVKFVGKVAGATDGATTTLTLEGQLQYDTGRGFIKRLELKQSERRIEGPVSPELTVDATVVVDRSLADDGGPLTDALVAKIPLEPDAELLRLQLATPWNVKLLHERGWRVFHQSQKVVILRLLDNGSLIAQCNIAQIPSAAPGKHVSEMQFQADIQTTLGKNLAQIVSAEELKFADKRYVYRVTANGTVEAGKDRKPRPMRWIFYLCANPDGRQVSFVMTIEETLAEKLAGRDQKLVQGLEFLPVAEPMATESK